MFPYELFDVEHKHRCALDLALERRELLYLDAVTHLCATFPEERQQQVWTHHTTRLMSADTLPETATADEMRVAGNPGPLRLGL